MGKVVPVCVSTHQYVQAGICNRNFNYLFTQRIINLILERLVLIFVQWNTIVLGGSMDFDCDDLVFFTRDRQLEVLL